MNDSKSLTAQSYTFTTPVLIPFLALWHSASLASRGPAARSFSGKAAQDFITAIGGFLGVRASAPFLAEG